MLRLRPATIEDAKALFDWRNDPETCANSINSNPVSWDGHLVWFNASLNSPTRKILVGVENGEPVSTVRYDKNGSVQELSWTVAPGCRRKGLGTETVLLAVSNSGPYIAAIKRENIASQKIAAKAGFSLVKDDPLQKWLRAY